jgi:NAD-dependent dihydropyrimidine dehydrogenase PreA subunit
MKSSRRLSRFAAQIVKSDFRPDLVHPIVPSVGDARDTGLRQVAVEEPARTCPFDAVHIHWDDRRYVAYPLIDVYKCNGCGACEVACPTEGIKAIRVWKRVD